MKILKSILARTLLFLEPEMRSAVDRAKKLAKDRLEEKKLAILGREQAEFREQEALSMRQEKDDAIARMQAQLEEKDQELVRQERRIEELEDIERIMTMRERLLVETVTGDIERRTLERLSIQAEKNYLETQAHKHVANRTEQSDRER